MGEPVGSKADGQPVGSKADNPESLSDNSQPNTNDDGQPVGSKADSPTEARPSQPAPDVKNEESTGS